MKKYAAFALAGAFALMFLVSCKKDKGANPYNNYITGVTLTNYDAVPVGTIGQPDVNNHTSNFNLSLYPTPSITSLMAAVVINNAAPVTLTVKLVSALYVNPPANAIIENETMPGMVMFSQSRGLPAAPPPDTTGGITPAFPGQTCTFRFDVSSMPRGFYRIYVETSDGERYWDNAWLMY